MPACRAAAADVREIEIDRDDFPGRSREVDRLAARTEYRRAAHAHRARDVH